MAYVDNGEEELDYEDEDYSETVAGARTGYVQPGGAIGALADDDLNEEEDYEDLYDDVDVGFFPNSSVGNSNEGRFQTSTQNGAEGFGEEDYAEDYEGVGREPVNDDEGLYEEEPVYQETEETLEIETERSPPNEADEDYEQEDYAKDSGVDDLKPEVETNEAEVEDTADAGVAIEEDRDLVAAVVQPKEEVLEPSRSDEYGRAPSVARVAPTIVKEEIDYEELDSEVGHAVVAGSNLLKPKEEPAYGSSSQNRTEVQLLKPAPARSSLAAVTTSAGWANGAANAVEGGGMGKGGNRGPVEGGVAGLWTGSTGRSIGGTATVSTSTPSVSAAPGNSVFVQAANKESSLPAADYVTKHGAAHQHESGGIMLFVGELHWWTTDAELEAALSEYGRVKNLKFFEEKASGKSKGYCQVEFYEASAARQCKEKMDGRIFNDRSCVVAYASPQSIKQMGAAQVGKSQTQIQGPPSSGPSRRTGGSEAGTGGRGGAPASHSGEGARGYGGREKMVGGRSQGPAMERSRGRGRGMGGRGGSMGRGETPFGQGPQGPIGGGPGGMMPPQGMMGGGFDPGFGPPMGGRGGGGYGMGPGVPGGGFGPRGHPFGGGPGMGPPFPAMVPGLPGVAPHVNPAFFGRANGNGPGIGIDGPAGAWGEGLLGWAGEEHERRMAYAEEMGAPDYGYPGEVGSERLRAGLARERERGADGEWVGADRRRREDRGDSEWERDRQRERDRDGYWDRDQAREKEKDWPERERPTATRGREKSRTEEEDRPRSRDEDFGKRRRIERKVER